jgi:outer membrane protein assembly factor BamD
MNNTARLFSRPLKSGALFTITLVILSACGTTAPKDETAQWSNEKLYAEAKEEQANGSYTQAIKLYETLEGRAAGTVLAQQAQLNRAHTLWRLNDRPQAMAVVDRFIKQHPTSPALDYALYLQGLINFNDDLGLLSSLSRQDLSERDQQASRDAYQSFKQLTERFPQSNYAEDAKARMNYIVNALARYEVHVASYYFRRGAYLAAANRAQQTVQEFQKSPAAEDALFIMVKSYDKLGLTELKDSAERVLRQNFPNSKLKMDTLGVREKKWWQFW